MSTSNTSQRRLKLFLRAEPEIGAEQTKQEVVDRLVELEREGHIDEYDIGVWGKSLRTDGPLTRTDYQREILAHLRAFREWAERHGVSLTCAFDERDVTSVLTEESYRVVDLPTACLAVYEDEALAGVYPCHDGSRSRSVLEYLEAMAADGQPRAADA
jgi:hypothetical protein